MRSTLSQNKRAGITLSEVLIALAITGIGIFALVTGFVKAWHCAASTYAEDSACVAAFWSKCARRSGIQTPIRRSIK